MSSGFGRNVEQITKAERTLLLFSLLNPIHEDACYVIGLNELLSPILRAAMTFISAKRTDQERAVLQGGITTCHCTPSIRATHCALLRPLPESLVLELVLFFMCGMIGTTSWAGKLQRLNVSPDLQSWPSRVSDIIPTEGEHELLAALVQWAATVPGGHSVFSLIGVLARFWRPREAPPKDAWCTTSPRAADPGIAEAICTAVTFLTHARTNFLDRQERAEARGMLLGAETAAEPVES
ncbi:hypothetical protein DFH07DRAFT_770950 [Mycena maculata]|uniref:Uncharacterized protein n=1 Tax=Mycena maculata TaxID=230809 RepID=A0AAD7JI87_9AGAR|nr:hypothetical protein DFH07DRAFT_770950 [Mycena maculata]